MPQNKSEFTREYQQFPSLCEHDTRDDVSRKGLKVDGVAPEVFTVGHRDVVEVVLADSQDVPINKFHVIHNFD